jgi:hypothetical protein
MRSILPIVALYVDPHVCATLGLILTAMTGAMGLLLLLSSGKPGQFLKTAEQRIAGAGGVFGLSYAACSLFWGFYGSLIHSRALVLSFYVGWKALGGSGDACLHSRAQKYQGLAESLCCHSHRIQSCCYLQLLNRPSNRLDYFPCSESRPVDRNVDLLRYVPVRRRARKAISEKQ